MKPGVQRLESNTLIKREYVHGTWDPDDEHYFLVVTHNQSAWTSAQRKGYQSQTYAIAVQLLDEERTGLNLHALVVAQAQLQARTSTRLRAR